MKTVDSLLPPELDYWVAKAEGIFFLRATDGLTYRIDREGAVYVATNPSRNFRYAPSSDWRIAGPIIVHHRISLQACGAGWIADCDRTHVAMASHPLIAAMRVRVEIAYGHMIEDEADRA